MCSQNNTEANGFAGKNACATLFYCGDTLTLKLLLEAPLD
jgi:hypothetical protein